MHPALRPLLTVCVLLAACDSPAAVPSAGRTPAGPDTPTVAPPTPGTPLAWVADNAHVVHSVTLDGSFGDLAPLRNAIGDARIVMLGEQTHGDGTTFLAKARLIAFLHREMGFDVLAWESGMYDMDRTWQQILADVDVHTATRRGTHGVWGGSEQVRPTLAYVAGTRNAGRVLEMAGFDVPLSGTVAEDSLAIHLAQFAREIRSPVVDDPAWAPAMVTLRNVAAGGWALVKPPPQEQETLLRILGTLRTHATAAGGRRALWWAQVLESLDACARMMWARPTGGGTSREADIIREDQMARNLVWLANHHWRGRKIIVWAHTAHISRNLPALRSMNGTVQGVPGLRPMGEQVHAALGNEMYALGFTAARGSYGLGTVAQQLQPPLAGSLEAHLDQLRMGYAFIDFRNRGAGGEWLQDVVTRALRYNDLRGDWPRVLDGMFYTREMVPSVLIPNTGPQ
jgi:erythromycin esterase